MSQRSSQTEVAYGQLKPSHLRCSISLMLSASPPPILHASPRRLHQTIILDPHRLSEIMAQVEADINPQGRYYLTPKRSEGQEGDAGLLGIKNMLDMWPLHMPIRGNQSEWSFGYGVSPSMNSQDQNYSSCNSSIIMQYHENIPYISYIKSICVQDGKMVFQNRESNDITITQNTIAYRNVLYSNFN